MELDPVCEGGQELISEQPEQVDGPSKDTQDTPLGPGGAVSEHTFIPLLSILHFFDDSTRHFKVEYYPKKLLSF